MVDTQHILESLMRTFLLVPLASLAVGCADKEEATPQSSEAEVTADWSPDTGSEPVDADADVSPPVAQWT